MNWELSGRLVQVSAALIAIPVALGGVYSLYHHHVSKQGVCETLRDKVLTIIDRSLEPSVKYVLVQHDVQQFQTKCADVDPDISHIFHVTITQLHASTSAEAPRAERSQPKPTGIQPAATPGRTVAAATAAPAVAPATSVDGLFGVSTAGEQRGWVALSRRDAGHLGESNFDGFADGQAAPPPVGTRLHARRTIPVWPEPQTHGSDPSKLQGRLARGACVEILSARAGTARTWAEVAPVPCQEAANTTRP